MINVKDEPRPDPVDDLPWGNSSSFFSEKASAPVFSAVAMWCLRAPAELPMMGEVKEGNKSKVTFGMSELRRGLLGFVKQCCHRVATKNRKSSFKKSQNSQRIFLLHKLFLRLVFSVLFLILFCTFWGFLLNKFLKVKIRKNCENSQGVAALLSSVFCRDVFGPGPSPKARRPEVIFPGPTRPEKKSSGFRAFGPEISEENHTFLKNIYLKN